MGRQGNGGSFSGLQACASAMQHTTRSSVRLGLLPSLTYLSRRKRWGGNKEPRVNIAHALMLWRPPGFVLEAPHCARACHASAAHIHIHPSHSQHNLRLEPGFLRGLSLELLSARFPPFSIPFSGLSHRYRRRLSSSNTSPPKNTLSLTPKAQHRRACTEQSQLPPPSGQTKTPETTCRCARTYPRIKRPTRSRSPRRRRDSPTQKQLPEKTRGTGSRRRQGGKGDLAGWGRA